MIPGIDPSNRYVQAGAIAALGIGVAGAAYLAKGYASSQAEEHHDCCGCSSISSAAVDAPVEIDTQPVNVQAEAKRTFLGSLGILAKSVFLLPVVVLASAFKALFSFVSSLFGNTSKAV